MDPDDGPPGSLPRRPSPGLAAIGSLRLVLILLLAVGAAALQLWHLIESDAAQPRGEPDLTLAFLRIDLGFYGLLCVLLWVACRRAGVSRHFSLGELPPRGAALRYLLLGLPMIGIGIAGFYLLFLPLSFVFPAFVSDWILDVPATFLFQAAPRAILADLLNLVLIVLIAPVVEEVFFRGFLLNALWRRYGFRTAVIVSSLIFAIPHLEVLGAFAFAAVLCVVFAGTRSLIGPILVHVSNNAIAVILEVGGSLTFGTTWNPMPLEDFRASWWLAPLGAAVGLPWLWLFLRRLPGVRTLRAAPDARP